MFVSFEDACTFLQQNRVVAIPSETVYGLAGHACSAEAVAQIFAAKKRPSTNPLIVHYASRVQAEKDVTFSPVAEKLARAFWPGPLTLVLESKLDNRLAPAVSAGLPSVAVRVPAHPLFQKLLLRCGFPLAAPSANPAGRLSATKAWHVTRALPGVPCLEGACAHYGVESTVVDARFEEPVLLRPGALAVEDLQNVLGMRVRTPQVFEQKQKIFHSPGLHPKHYAPLKPLRLKVSSVGPDEGLLAFGKAPLKGAMMTLNLSAKGCLEEATHHFFDYLQQLDQSPCRRIAVMSLSHEGLGATLNERLTRAAQSLTHVA